MATSYVEYNNFGFWSHDQFLSAILFLIQKHLAENDRNEFLENIKLNLIDASTGDYVGCIPNYIEDFNDLEKHSYLKNSILKSIEDINNNESSLILEFNKNKVGGYSWQTMPTKEIIKIAELLMKLIAGELETNASSKIDD